MQIEKNVLQLLKKVDKKNSCSYKQQHIVCLVVLYTMMRFNTASCGRDKNFEERRLTRWLKQQQRSPQQRSRRPSPPRRQPRAAPKRSSSFNERGFSSEKTGMGDHPLFYFCRRTSKLLKKSFHNIM